MATPELMEQMNIVIVGHVDHGKSTVIGRLLADTDSLPKGKLEQVKAFCAANSRPFEYAFLLDALKDEQAQGITIDSARCFFKTDKRHYIIIDAPGHIEFLKNMISGAARAEAALLVIDAHEGVRENSKRHGHLMSMLGIKQLVVLVNKMDLVGHSQERFESIKSEYSEFLTQVGVQPLGFIPISALEGHNIANLAQSMPWYQGATVLQQLDNFKKQAAKVEKPFRMPVQDIYKFTAQGDDRRLVVGTIDTGCIEVGTPVTFYPSHKKSIIKSIENFPEKPINQAFAGQASSFTLKDQIYIRPGEIMVKDTDPPPLCTQRFRANLFWMSKNPMVTGKNYKIKLGSRQSPVVLVKIFSILDSSTLGRETHKQQIGRHDVAEVLLETSKPLAFDLATEFENTGRFVLVDQYEISGGGIVLEALSDSETTLSDHIKVRESGWVHSKITAAQRTSHYHHKAKFVLLSGQNNQQSLAFAQSLEHKLFHDKYPVYFLGLSQMVEGVSADLNSSSFRLEDQLRRLGELARILTDAGLIFIATVPELDQYDVKVLQMLNAPHEISLIHIGDTAPDDYKPDLQIPDAFTAEQSTERIYKFLKEKEIILEYFL